MRCFATLLACAALLSTTFARVLPKVKRDNTTCCGYKLTNRDDMRFRYQHVIDFSAMTSLDQVYQAGWGISNGWQTGGTNPSTGQYTVASESNVRIVPGQGLTLTIPGGQSPSAKTFSGAEISFPYTVLGGYFEIEARITSLRGTVFGMFTSHADPWDAPRGWQDSQFIEILSSSLMLPTPYTAAGMQLTNYDPHTGSMYRTVAPFPSDPVASTLAGPAYHKWSIAWLPTLSCPALNQPGSTTKYRYDGNLLNGPTAGSSKNPSTLLLSFWTNADPQFSVGPPSTNAVITIKQIRAYYDTPNKIADGACPTKNTFDCTVAMSCPVTVF